MGIRVKKMLGYGLTDLVPDDPRINWKSWMVQHASEPEPYRDWLARKGRSTELAMLSQIPQLDFSNCLAYDEEYGLSEVFALRPSWAQDWRRSDDTIDWIEETYMKGPRDQNGDPWVKVLPDGIYPFNGLFMDSRTGERVSHEAAGFRRFEAMIRREKNNKEPLIAFSEEHAQAHLGMSRAQAKRYLKPWVPDDIRNIAEFGQVFTSPEVVRQLRPVLYCWWS